MGLQQYLAAETRHAQAWMQPLSALQRQLQREMLQHTPDQQVPLLHIAADVDIHFQGALKAL